MAEINEEESGFKFFFFFKWNKARRVYFEFKEKSEDGLLSVGLEQVAKHLTKLSKGKLNL